MNGRVRGACWLAGWMGILMVGAACGGGEPRAAGEVSVPAAPAAAAAAPVDTAQGGQSAWVRQLGGLGAEQVWTAASGADGVSAVTLIGEPGASGKPPYDLGLVRLRADGSIAWARQFTGLSSAEQLTWISVAVSGMGNTFLSLHVQCTVGRDCMDFGAGGATGSLLLKFDPAGKLVWQRVIAAEEGRSNVTVDGNGGPAVAVWRASGANAGRRLVRYQWDGALIYDVAVPVSGRPAGYDDFYPLTLGFDPAGNLAVGDGPLFYSLDGQGHLRWQAPLPNASVTSIGGTSLGTVVVLAQFIGDTVTWAGTSSTAPDGASGAFLAVAEANGTPRFGRAIGTDDRTPLGAAVDPAGRVAILTLGPDGCERLEKWNLAGAQLWSRGVVTGCSGGRAVTTWSVSVDPVSHHVRVGGLLLGTANFGTGPVTSRGSADGFVLDVQP